MTFYELIRSSLLMDSKRNRPPGMLIQAVLDTWKTMAGHAAARRPELSDASKHSEEQIPNN